MSPTAMEASDAKGQTGMSGEEDKPDEMGKTQQSGVTGQQSNRSKKNDQDADPQKEEEG